MGWWDRPLLITDVEKPYWRKGLLYIPVLSFRRRAELVTAPHVALEGAKRVTSAISGAMLFELPDLPERKG